MVGVKEDSIRSAEMMLNVAGRRAVTVEGAIGDLEVLFFVGFCFYEVFL